MRMDKLTSRFQQAIADAQSLAVGRDHTIIEPAHLLLALLDQQMHRFDDVVIATDGQRLGVGDGLLETRGEFVHAHGLDSARKGGEAAMLTE